MSVRSTILYVTYARMPTEKAHGIQITSMCKAFAEEGAAVTLVVPTWENYLGVSLFEYYKLSALFDVEYVRAGPLLPLRVGRIVREGVFSLLARRHLAGRKGGVVITRSPWVLWALAPRHEVFYEVHDIPAGYRALWKFLVRRANGYISTNRFKVEELSRIFGIDPSRICVAPNGYDPSLFDFVDSKQELRRQLSLPPDKRVVLYAGNVYGWKGVYALSEAAAKSPDELFVFVGGTDGDVVRFREKYKNSKNILLVPHQQHHVIPHYLKAADVLVLPNSATTEESRRMTSPIKLFEYLASGTPVIASDLPSIREVVGEKEVHFCRPDDAESLAQALREVREHPEEAAARALKGRELVQAYTWRSRARHIGAFIAAHTRREDR